MSDAWNDPFADATPKEAPDCGGCNDTGWVLHDVIAGETCYEACRDCNPAGERAHAAPSVGRLHCPQRDADRHPCEHEAGHDGDHLFID